MKKIFCIILIFTIFLELKSQSTEECGKRLGCFTFPSNCKDSECTFIYKWGSFISNNSHQFILATKIDDPNLVNSAWLAIGFSTDSQMGNDDVIICKNSNVEKSIQRYFNSGKFTPSLLDPRNPEIGISDPRILINNNFMICSFTREKSNPNFQNYFDLNNKFHILSAYGQIGSSGELIQHLLKIPSQNLIDFSTDTIAIANSDGVKVKAHAAFMIIAWTIFATLGMIIARYFKFIFPDVRFLELKIWFVIHRPLMYTAYILTIIGFFVILADQNWTWIERTRTTSFVHSFFGLIVIILCFLQILVAFFRPHQDHQNRYIFNYFHSANGTVILLLSVITMFLGTAIKRTNLEARGIGIMVSWTVWILVFVLLAEMAEKKFKKEQAAVTLNNLSNDMYQNNQKNTELQIKLENIKFVLLGAHVLVAVGLTFEIKDENSFCNKRQNDTPVLSIQIEVDPNIELPKELSKNEANQLGSSEKRRRTSLIKKIESILNYYMPTVFYIYANLKFNASRIMNNT
ncbi:ferric-chelate reductase 1 [Brachionus plicatilis]|uniref:Ferric-chelate reductase 1 n=1 Tax=Brachionus plicatilis TaxID=10195 RepID=A0A3M7Q5F8_BRAPC|nr:ferric-chelate reductase 1 [Brachionus plicatilis]